jgi:hypothetical protein
VPLPLPYSPSCGSEVGGGDFKNGYEAASIVALFSAQLASSGVPFIMHFPGRSCALWGDFRPRPPSLRQDSRVRNCDDL